MDMEVFTIKLPEKIQCARRRAGLSQEQLAEQLGISRQAVSKWETGEAMPDATKLAPLASALGVSIDWLLSEDEPQFASEPEEDWADKLPRHISRLAKRWGWLAGVYIAVMGGVFAAMACWPDSRCRGWSGGCLQSAVSAPSATPSLTILRATTP